MRTLNPSELDVVAGAFPGLGLIVCGPLGSAILEAGKSLTSEGSSEQNS